MMTLTLPNLLTLEKRLDEIPFDEIGNSIPERMDQLTSAKHAQAWFPPNFPRAAGAGSAPSVKGL
tara:strand:+ start:215 stop:409 length:195 start_codon:yes stop_codon:yes gene_type:complete